MESSKFSPVFTHRLWSSPVSLRLIRSFLPSFSVLTIAALLSVSLSGCSTGTDAAAGSHPNAAKADGSSKTDAAPAAEASSTGEASFSYTIDGMSFSSAGTDDFANCAYKNNNGVVNYVLMNIAKGQKGVPTQIHIYGPDHGSATFQAGDPKYSVEYSYSDVDGKGSHGYNPISMTVTILSNTPTRISGTFSGTFDVLNENRSTSLTDGKFDIPYSSHSAK